MANKLDTVKKDLVDYVMLERSKYRTYISESNILTDEEKKVEQYGLSADNEKENCEKAYDYYFEKICEEEKHKLIYEDDYYFEQAWKLLSFAERKRIINAADSETAEELKKLLVTFRDLPKFDDSVIIELLKSSDEVYNELIYAMKDLTEFEYPGVEEKIYKNMSKRAALMLQEDIEFTGVIKEELINEARDKICKRLIEYIKD